MKYLSLLTVLVVCWLGPRIVEGADHITTLTKPEFASALLMFLRSGKPD
jgi:hypothetical protein